MNDAELETCLKQKLADPCEDTELIAWRQLVAVLRQMCIDEGIDPDDLPIVDDPETKAAIDAAIKAAIEAAVRRLTPGAH